MKKDVHVYIDYQLTNRIEKLAKTQHMTLSNIYTELLNKALEQKEALLNFELFDMSLKKIIKNTNYTKSLIRKMYSDSNIKYSNDTNQNLLDFDSSYLSNRKRLGE